MALLLGPPALVANHVASQPYRALSFLAAFKLSCLVYLSALLISVIAYRLSPFHPLAKYPGPLLWRVSMFSSGLYSTTGNKSRYIKKLHDIHGDIIRIGMRLALFGRVSTHLGNGGRTERALHSGSFGRSGASRSKRRT